MKAGRVMRAIIWITAMWWAGAECGAAWWQGSGEPGLHLAAFEPNGRDVAAADANCGVGKRDKLVVVTHGWFEKSAWSREMALAIRGKVDGNEWVCGWYDWQKQARHVNPTEAAKYAKEKAGVMLAEEILKTSKEWKHIHLIGHSAGSWLVSEAGKRLAKETKASIHLTFLDAYVPPGWDEAQLGNIGEANGTCWAEQYLTRDATMKVTERWLTHAHNVDISDVTPGVKDHEFPRYWYRATVSGGYVKGQWYAGKELMTEAAGMEYGFARSLEAGEENWKKSVTLPMGGEAIRMEKHNEEKKK